MLCGITPSDIRRNKNKLDLRNRALSDDHMLNFIANNPLLDGRLKSRSPLSRRMHSLGLMQNGSNAGMILLTN